MELQRAKRKARELMTEHGLTQKGWTFQFDNAKGRYGVCRYSKKVIGLSRVLTPLAKDEDVIDTILHEIAHALVGRGHGHNHVWRRKAIEIGCSGNRCGDKHNDEEMTYKWIGTCPNGHVSKRHKLTAKAHRVSCGECRSYYDPRFRFNWVQQY